MGGSFFRLFNRQTGASVDNDEIFPVHYLDQRSLLPELILSVTFRCNDVLDPEKLRDSLVELLELDGWRKLGGRLRRNVRNMLGAFTSEKAKNLARRLIYTF